MTAVPAPEPVRLSIANNALLEVPAYEEHRRGTNWLAVIDIDGTAPAGLARRFFPKAKGACFYMIEQLMIFDPVEFGADYTTGYGDKRRKRWYGVVVAKTDDFLLVQPCSTGVNAVQHSKKLRTSPDAHRTALMVERQQLLDRAAKVAQEIAVIDTEVSPATPEVEAQQPS